MLVMTDADPSPLLGTSAFRLGVVGAVVTERFAAEIAGYDLKPKHVGVLALLASAPATSQLDLARTMGVAPSLIVRIADHLERIGAVERVRDPADRRRQALRLTPRGTELLAACTRLSRSMERDLLAGLSAPDRASFRTALARVATNLDLPS
jgi:DNA-binding MarR family transcriptional regulator